MFALVKLKPSRHTLSTIIWKRPLFHLYRSIKMMSKPLYFKLYQCNQLVRGKQWGAVYLLNRNRIERLPLGIYDLIKELDETPVSYVEKNYRNGVVQEWIEYFLKYSLGFLTDEPNRFTRLPEEYLKPSLLQRGQIEYDLHNPNYDIGVAIASFEELLCKHLELRIVGRSVGLADIHEFLSLFDDCCSRSILLLIEKSSLKTHELNKLLQMHPKIYRIILFEQPPISISQQWLLTTVKKSYQELTSRPWDLGCTIISMSFYLESLQHNTFYHKKMAISRDGYIKNDLILTANFGRILQEKDTVLEVYRSDLFRQFWDVSVDRIEGLKDSELRYALYPARALYEQDGL